MKGLVLAAGRGSRMQRLTEDRPKALVELGGRPLFEWQLAALKGAGLAELGVVAGYRAAAFERFGLARRFHNARWSETNMVRSLAEAREWLTSDTCIVSYSDIVYGTAAVAGLMEARADIAMAYDPNWFSLWSRRFSDPLSDAETFALDAASHVTDIGSKPTSIEEVNGQYMGLLRITPKGWATIEGILGALSDQDVDRLDMTSLLSRCLKNRVPILAVAAPEPWGEVDSESDLRLYEQLLARGEFNVTVGATARKPSR